MGAFSIVGFSSTYKRPIFAAKLMMAVGALVAAAAPTVCLVVGQKTSSGTMTDDAAPVICISEDDADTKGGPGSEVARAARAALAKGAVVYMGSITPGESSTAPTTTSVISGTWSTSGTWRMRAAGIAIEMGIGASDAIDTVGAALVTKINSYTQLPFTAAYNTGSDTLTLTHKNTGVRFKDTIVTIDLTDAPSGFAMTLVGSATLNSGTIKRVRMGASSSGTVADDVTTFLATLAGTRYARHAWGPADSTNAALIEAYVDGKLNPTEVIYEQAVFGHNGSSSAAISIAQSTLNHYFSQVVAQRNSYTFPTEIAASMAGFRAAVEGDTPVYDFDNAVLPKVEPQEFAADKWTPTEEELLLNGGVTPVRTVDGKATIVRAICTYSLLNGSTADDRCLDIGDPTAIQHFALDLQLFWESDFRVANPYVGPNPADGEPEAESGIATPADWQAAVEGRRADLVPYTLEPVTAETKCQAEYNKTARRIECSVGAVARRLQHQIGLIVRQQTPA